jgi:hypothetical protein
MPTALSLDDLGIRQPPALLVPPSRSGARSAGKPANGADDLGHFARETVANLERLVEQAEEQVVSEGVEFLGALIERLASIEAGTRAECRDMQKSSETARQVRRLLQELPKSAPGRTELLKGVERPLARMEQWIEAAEAVLPAYRDARWKLMALRADHEDPGDAPVFDDPEELEQYLARG